MMGDMMAFRSLGKKAVLIICVKLLSTKLYVPTQAQLHSRNSNTGSKDAISLFTNSQISIYSATYDSSDCCLMQYGLYSAYIGSIVYVFLGSAKDITLGPSAISSLMTYVYCSSPINKDPSVAIVASFLCGFIYIAMFMFGLGQYQLYYTAKCQRFILLFSHNVPV